MSKQVLRRDPTGYLDWTYPVSIVAQLIEHLKVDISAQTLSELKIDIVSQSLPALNVNITGSDVTLNVNIASSSVAINIKTETGANIIIDKLTAAAYTEERRIIANNGPSATMMAPGTTYRRGKYFPRGCRGFIKEIEVYCDNPDTASHKLYIYVSPQPGMAPIISAELTVGAMTSPAWRVAAIRRYWNYDSLFVWVLGETNDYPRVGYDTGEPYDYYSSSDGITWAPANYRWWIRLDMTGQTVGDLPVTGTLNTIEVPNVFSDIVKKTAVEVEPGTSIDILPSVNATGKVTCLQFSTKGVDPSSLKLHIVVDGKDITARVIELGASTLETTKAYARVSIAYWDTTNHWYAIAFNFDICFKQSIHIYLENLDTTATAEVSSIAAYEVIA